MKTIYQWEVIQQSPEKAYELAQALQVSPIVAQLLVNRGITTPSEAQHYLNPEPEIRLPVPGFAPELRQYFRELLQQDVLIAIHGDYDVDGLTGTALLYTFLKNSGARVRPFLPTRERGYGLTGETIQQFAAEGVALIITVDCGISNAAEIAAARELGIETIITDHHGMPETLPQIRFTLHPKVLGIPEIENLAGVGMAYWLVTLLDGHLPARQPIPLSAYLDLLAIGTVGDLTPLTGVNRDLVKRGLHHFRHTRRPGIQALCDLTRVRQSEATEEDLSFRIIPQLNAAGRIASPDIALALLLASRPEKAQALAQQLSELNKRRQELCLQVFEAAREQASQQADAQTIVLASPDWPHGVLGIVCSKLVELSHKPVFLLEIVGETAKGSARSPAYFHVLDSLQAASPHLLKFGGHAQAGGFSLHQEDIPAFAAALEDFARQQKPRPEPALAIDMEIRPEAWSLDLYQQLRQMGPFGPQNPVPLFVSVNTPLRRMRCDANAKHLFAEVASLSLKAWNKWQPEYDRFSGALDIVYTLSLDTWQGRTSLSLSCVDIREHRPLASQPQRTLQQEPLPFRLELGQPPRGLLLHHPSSGLYHYLDNPETLAATWTEPEICDWRHERDIQATLERLQSQYYEQLLVLAPTASQPGTPLDREATFSDLALVGPLWDKPVLSSLLPRLGCQRLHLLPGPRGKAIFAFPDLLGLLDYLRTRPPAQGLTTREIARQLQLDETECFYRLSALIDLGILSWHNEGSGICFKNTCYDLSSSQAYITYSQQAESYLADLQLWQVSTGQKIKESLLSNAV